jgi:hypothetical protein
VEVKRTKQGSTKKAQFLAYQSLSKKRKRRECEEKRKRKDEQEKRKEKK